MKSPHFIIRYLIEGVLIFGSVYGAFLLEDHRSQTEQEQLFAKRWAGLIQSLSNDSLKLTALLYDTDNSGLFNPDLGIYNWVEKDSLVLANYERLLRSENVSPIIEGIQAHYFWAMSYIEPAPYYQDIIDNHPDIYLEICSVNPQLCEGLDTYFQYHSRIDRYNRYTREKQIEFSYELDRSFPNPRVATHTDSLAIANDFRSRNYLLNRQRHINTFTLPAIVFMLELNGKMYPSLRDFDLKMIGID